MKLYNYINKKIGTKIIFWMFILMSISSLAVLSSTLMQIQNNSIIETKHNLNMLSSSMFQTLRNAMNTGDSIEIKRVEEEARDIEGVQHLTIAKSKGLIELYSPQTAFTDDITIINSFNNKINQIIEIDTDNTHALRMIKPMIATNECIICHANQNIGDVIGVMDLTFSLDSSDQHIESITLNIILISTLLGWITILIIFYIIRVTTKPIEGLKEGFENLLASTDSHNALKLKIKSSDEIGEVAQLFNKYMDKLTHDLTEDAEEYTKSIMDSQKNIVITTEKEQLRTVNKAFLDFFGVKDISEFQENYFHCICDAFVENKNDEFLNKMVGNKTWNEYIIKHKEKLHKVIINFNNQKYIFAVSGDKFSFMGEEIYTAVFTDITEFEKAKQEIQTMHKHTRDSIEYASLIQGALVPDNEMFRKYFKDYFVIWRPKDLVGGDIYLFEELRHDDECLIMVIDCTGHGVPGAFVTMLVKAIERQIVSYIKYSDEIVNPAKLLSIFNKNMKQLLKQESVDSVSNAGFDGQIIYYNKAEKVLKVASARNEVFYYQDDELHIIKGDRHSVGYKDSDVKFEFTEHIIDISKETTLYISSDGFWDQNGGEKGLPYGKKRLKKLLAEIHKESLSNQQEEFLYTFEEYKGVNEINDDVTVVAIKI